MASQPADPADAACLVSEMTLLADTPSAAPPENTKLNKNIFRMLIGELLCFILLLSVRFDEIGRHL